MMLPPRCHLPPRPSHARLRYSAGNRTVHQAPTAAVTPDRQTRSLLTDKATWVTQAALRVPTCGLTSTDGYSAPAGSKAGDRPPPEPRIRRARPVAASFGDGGMTEFEEHVDERKVELGSWGRPCQAPCDRPTVGQLTRIWGLDSLSLGSRPRGWCMSQPSRDPVSAG